MGIRRFTASWLGQRSERGRRRVLCIRSSPLPAYDLAVRGFVKALEARGIVLRILDVDLSTPKRRISFLEALRGFDLLLTLGTAAAEWARKSAWRVLPAVHSMILDPAGHGFRHAAASLDANPSVKADLVRRWFPGLRRIGVPVSPGRNPEAVEELQTLPDVLLAETGPGGLGLREALTGLAGRADCVLLLPDAELYSPERINQVLQLCLKRQIPVIGVSPAHVAAGALAAIHGDPEDNGRQAADMARRIWAGEAPGAIPWRWAEKYKTSVNLPLARRLGLGVMARVEDGNELYIESNGPSAGR